jgi:hypothetical protein
MEDDKYKHQKLYYANHAEEVKAKRREHYLKNKCEHGKQKRYCKDCGGNSLCLHERVKSQCKECGGGSICEHGRVKSTCKECGGSAICEHSRRKQQCKECGGSSICEHGKQKSRCKECGGSGICEHGKDKTICKDCGGSALCEHEVERRRCKVCSIHTYLVFLQRMRLNRILKDANQTKTKSTIEYLDCSPEYFKEYLQSKMVEGMTFDNIHIDHIKPVSKFDLENPEEMLMCCHYTNMQPLLANDNIIKSDKWTDKDNIFWTENIIYKEYLPLYIPK